MDGSWATRSLGVSLYYTKIDPKVTTDMQQRTALMFYLLIFILHIIVQALKIKIRSEKKNLDPS